MSAFPFSATNNLLNLSDILIDHIVCLFFRGHNVHGDLRTLVAAAASSDSAWVGHSSSTNCAYVLAMALMGYLVAKCLLVFIGSNLE